MNSAAECRIDYYADISGLCYGVRIQGLHAVGIIRDRSGKRASYPEGDNDQG
jgi:hypothetical protein